ncbi:MAG: hypothetical protein J7641_21165 [Cyanobacteria bacterium SID2]|nr:hypothetical protein [Cyanobacteria bacterium SID2]MBP0006380.1 hypothetical protein [Cyanobacteria bacterium SBC]
MQRLEYWLTPLLLVTIAIVQIYLASTANLSPWKGGGFGMFSTIDAPSMRVLLAEGVDTENQLVRLDVFGDLDKPTRRRLQALPKVDDLEEIAQQLLAQEFVPIEIRREVIYKKLQAENPSIEFPQIETRSNSQPLYRIKSPRDPIDLERPIKTLKRARLQWLRLRFDVDRTRMWIEPMTDAIEVSRIAKNEP